MIFVGEPRGPGSRRVPGAGGGAGPAERRSPTVPRPYARLMLPALRDSGGKPAAPVRLLALLLALGMLALAAPAVVPVVRWVLSALF